jgi:hypothetical protein
MGQIVSFERENLVHKGVCFPARANTKLYKQKRALFWWVDEAADAA